MSGVGGTDSTNNFFNDTGHQPPSGPSAGSTVRSRRPPPPAAATKRSSASTVAPKPLVTSSSSMVGTRKITGSSSSAAPGISNASSRTQPPSYYLSPNVNNTPNLPHHHNSSNQENSTSNINTATTPKFFTPSAATPQTSSTTTASGSSSYYSVAPSSLDAHGTDWYTPSVTTTVGVGTTAPSAPMSGGPNIINPYMSQQPLSSMMDSSLSSSLMTDTTNTVDSTSYDDYANEPPLMEELGINVEHIAWKTRAVVLPFSRRVFRSIRNKGFQNRFSGGGDDDDDHHPMSSPQVMVQDADLAGPLAFAVLLGAELLLAGKLSFGYIYGFGLFGCLSMTLILNLMQPQPGASSDPAVGVAVTTTAAGISFWSVTSILGYSLLPVNGLAAFKLLLVNNPFWKLHTVLRILAVITIAWSTIASTRLFEQGFGFRHQRYLIAYPIALVYSAFVLITIFDHK